ncbi:hypothetical protein J6590_059599 [Homalodisca vitripennis]|nr:hypothetical protein J6590_059599 [Homalodisca vitripennis]
MFSESKKYIIQAPQGRPTGCRAIRRPVVTVPLWLVVPPIILFYVTDVRTRYLVSRFRVKIKRKHNDYQKRLHYLFRAIGEVYNGEPWQQNTDPVATDSDEEVEPGDY